MADFCGVTVESVTRWLHRTGSFPIGEPLIKLMCYLDMLGYSVIELERMTNVRRNFTELIGYGLLTSEHATELLGYSTTSTLYKILHGHHNASDDKDQKMWDIWKERKEQLQVKKAESELLYRLGTPLKIEQSEDTYDVSEQKIAKVRPKAVISIMKGLLELLEDYSFDTLSEDELDSLKASVDIIRKLLAQLSALNYRLIMSARGYN